jgi:hypothetical protein
VGRKCTQVSLEIVFFIFHADFGLNVLNVVFTPQPITTILAMGLKEGTSDSLLAMGLKEGTSDSLLAMGLKEGTSDSLLAMGLKEGTSDSLLAMGLKEGTSDSLLPPTKILATKRNVM